MPVGADLQRTRWWRREALNTWVTAPRAALGGQKEARGLPELCAVPWKHDLSFQEMRKPLWLSELLTHSATSAWQLRRSEQLQDVPCFGEAQQQLLRITASLHLHLSDELQTQCKSIFAIQNMLSKSGSVSLRRCGIECKWTVSSDGINLCHRKKKLFHLLHVLHDQKCVDLCVATLRPLQMGFLWNCLFSTLQDLSLDGARWKATFHQMKKLQLPSYTAARKSFFKKRERKKENICWVTLRESMRKPYKAK